MSFNNLENLMVYRDTHAAVGITPAFVEILWDNFCHLDPYYLRDLLSPLADEISIHVMATAITDRPITDYKRVLTNLAAHVRALQPSRVSDHLARFTIDGLRMIIPAEHTYTNMKHATERVRRYQDAIGMPLLVENYASTTCAGASQIDFLDTLQSKTGCGLLFDVSNAVVAHLNGHLSNDAWLDYLNGKRVHSHMGSYRFNPTTGMYHDTHNEAPSPPALELLKRLTLTDSIISVCYERDYDQTPKNAESDLKAIAEALNHNQRLPPPARTSCP